MTAIAAFLNEGRPFLVGDILISGLKQEGAALVLPTVDQWQEFVSSHRDAIYPKSLAQKVVVLSPNLALGWSGSLIAARMAIRAIQEAHLGGHLTIDSLRLIIEEVEGDVSGHDLGLTGFLVENSNVHSFSLNPNDQCSSIGSYQSVSLLGSGSSSFRRILSTDPEDVRPSGENPVLMSLFSALRLTGLALLEEVQNPYVLNDMFGAGYEVAHWGPNGFEKLDDVTYVFFNAIRRRKAFEIQFCRALKYKYVGQYLHIATARPTEPQHEGSPPTLDVFGVSLQPLLHIDSAVKAPAFSVPEWNSRFFICMFRCYQDAVPKTVYATIDYCPDGYTPNIVVGPDGFHVQSSYMEGLKNHLAHVLPQVD